LVLQNYSKLLTLTVFFQSDNPVSKDYSWFCLIKTNFFLTMYTRKFPSLHDNTGKEEFGCKGPVFGQRTDTSIRTYPPVFGQRTDTSIHTCSLEMQLTLRLLSLKLSDNKMRHCPWDCLSRRLTIIYATNTVSTSFEAFWHTSWWPWRSSSNKYWIVTGLGYFLDN